MPSKRQKVNVEGPMPFVVRPIAYMSDFYLTTIGMPELYTKWFDAIRNAQPQDVIKIHINSPGGHMWTAIQFIRVINECHGTVIASVEGICASAATLILLNCHAYEISEHSTFMFHNYTGGMFGKGGEMYDQITYERKWSHDLFKSQYSGFLSDTEIDDIMEGKDIWIGSDEAFTRIERRADKIAKDIEMLQNKQSKPNGPTENPCIAARAGVQEDAAATENVPEVKKRKRKTKGKSITRHNNALNKRI